MASVFLNEHATLRSLVEDSLDDVFEQNYLLWNCFNCIYKAVHVPQGIRQAGYALVYSHLSHDNLGIHSIQRWEGEMEKK